MPSASTCAAPAAIAGIPGARIRRSLALALTGSYPGSNVKGNPMTIRKTGSATGQVTGIEDLQEEGIRKAASADPDWHPLDDDLLAAENQSADADGPAAG